MNARDVPSARRWITAVGLLFVGAAFCQNVFSQDEEQPAAPLTPAELEELVGPVALYPDDLLALVLPASTYPLQIVQAARYLEDRANDSTLTPNEEWDDSIVALINYPEVIRMMNEDLEWTWALGQAVIDNQGAVLGAVQTFRDRAYAAGNLRTDEKQVVTEDAGVIEIAPADPEVVYIPYYEPERVVVYQPSPAYYYYPYAYPLYYYPYPWGYHFATPYFWGLTSAFVIGWHSHFLHVHHHSHFGHPYYGHHYYTDAPYYWRHDVYPHANRVANVWEPTHRRGAQPHYRDDGRRVRTAYEGYGGTRRQVSSGARARTLEGGDASRSGVAGTNRTVTAPRRTIGGVASRTPADRNAGARPVAPDRAIGAAPSASDSGTVRARTAPSRRTETSEPAARSARDASRSEQRTIGGVTRQPTTREAVRARVPSSTARTNAVAIRPPSMALRSPPVQRSAPIERSAPAPRSAPAFAPPAQRSAPASAAPRTMQGGSGSAPASRSAGVARGGSASVRGGAHRSR